MPGAGLYLRVAGIGLAIGLDLAAVIAYPRNPNVVFGVPGWLWLASMGLCWPPAPAGIRATSRKPTWDRPGAGAKCASSWAWWRSALFTQVAWLDDIPWRFHFDEGIASPSRCAFISGPTISLFTTTWHNTSLPSLWFAVSGGLMHLTGMGLGGVRLGVALVGALTVIPTYGLGRLLAGAALRRSWPGLPWPSRRRMMHYSRVSIST